ncbi:hypothetical protein WJX74_010925 [Apatococcus lobatus]|uniref:Cysteine-rich transmembrane domain-containing protein n=2 Tax=Apatococcus TaxID=904362 RepID=A0AAW1T3B0_9CHLO
MVNAQQIDPASKASPAVAPAHQEISQGPGVPPPGYPLNGVTPQFPADFKLESRSRDEKGCIEGCLAALCCCFICEECC